MSTFALYLAKTVVSALVIVAVSEIARRSTTMAALVAYLPLTSLLAFVWMHLDGTEPSRIAELSLKVLWLVLPSLAFFVVLALLIQRGWGFWARLGSAVAVTAAGYAVLLFFLPEA